MNPFSKWFEGLDQDIIALAPMEGVVDWNMRDILSRLGGYSFCVTEFMRVTDRLQPDHVFHRMCPELKSGSKTSNGTPVLFQLLGGVPEAVAENAAKAVELGAFGIDLNFGCPAKTVNRHDGGAALLKNPSRVFDVVKAVRQKVPFQISVSAKVRLGFEHKDFATDIAQAAAEADASWLTIHARTKLEMYTPPAHWDFIALMASKISIPVIANGDIFSPQDALQCKKVTGVNHLMVGRGAIARPHLALEIREARPDMNSQRKPWSEIENLLEVYNERNKRLNLGFALSRYKQWVRQLALQYPEAKILFDQIKTVQKMQEIDKAPVIIHNAPNA